MRDGGGTHLLFGDSHVVSLGKADVRQLKGHGDGVDPLLAGLFVSLQLEPEVFLHGGLDEPPSSLKLGDHELRAGVVNGREARLFDYRGPLVKIAVLDDGRVDVCGYHLVLSRASMEGSERASQRLSAASSRSHLKRHGESHQQPVVGDARPVVEIHGDVRRGELDETETRRPQKEPPRLCGIFQLLLVNVVLDPHLGGRHLLQGGRDQADGHAQADERERPAESTPEHGRHVGVGAGASVADGGDGFVAGRGFPLPVEVDVLGRRGDGNRCAAVTSGGKERVVFFPGRFQIF